MMTINFDMDGTIADFYGVDGWLNYLMNEDATPYEIAKPLVNLNRLARYLNKLQKNGYRIAIVSWLSKTSTEDFDKAVTDAKIKWLAKHLPSVHFDEINIVAYGTPKHEISKGILFDDEKPNRDGWGFGAYEPSEIFEILKAL